MFLSGGPAKRFHEVGGRWWNTGLRLQLLIMAKMNSLVKSKGFAASRVLPKELADSAVAYVPYSEYQSHLNPQSQSSISGARLATMSLL